MNLFYDLPEDLLYLIYRQFYSSFVMIELIERPGNFSWLDGPCCLEYQLKRDYREIDKIGPGAWSFLKNCNNCILNANRFDPMFKQITNILFKNSGHSSYSFRISMNTMEYIAKNGWKQYKKK